MRPAILGVVTCFAMIAAAQASDTSPTIHSLMKDIIAPQADQLWEVSGSAMNDDGEPDGSALSAQDWGRITEAATKMKTASVQMASTPDIAVSLTGVAISGEDTPGAVTAQQVKQYIAADPTGFAHESTQLAVIADSFLQAAAARDAARLQQATEEMGAACEGCHKKFWYPEQ